MRVFTLTRHTAVLALALAGACGRDDGGAVPIDGALSVDTFDVCEGACTTTSLTAAFATTTTLDHAFYGVTAGAPSSLYVEIDNGLTVCPEMSSPTPKYSLILGTVGVPTDATASTSPGNMLDYEGDLFPPPTSGPATLGQRATTVTLTPTAAKNVLDAAGFIAIDTKLVFPDGTITGHFYAQHCASLDRADGT